MTTDTVTTPIDLPCRVHEVLATHTRGLVFIHGAPHVHYNLAALRKAVDSGAIRQDAVAYSARKSIADHCLHCGEPLDEDVHCDDYCGNDCAVDHGRELLTLVGDLRMELRELHAKLAKPGVLVTFPDERDRTPDDATVEYLANADSAVDMGEAARALLDRAVSFTELDCHEERALARLAYDATTAYVDAMWDADTGTRHAMTHALTTLAANPAPAWEPTKDNDR